MSTALTFPAFGSVVRTSATYFASVLSIHVYGVDVLLTSVGSPPIDGRTRNICASADPISSVMYKSAVVTYVAGAAALVWLSGTVVGAINSIPVLPKVMELVGLGYSSWFVYRYVLYKDSRKELVEQFDALKNKVSGEF